jgi:hypothetical protein
LLDLLKPKGPLFAPVSKWVLLGLSSAARHHQSNSPLVPAKPTAAGAKKCLRASIAVRVGATTTGPFWIWVMAGVGTTSMNVAKTEVAVITDLGSAVEIPFP